MTTPTEEGLTVRGIASVRRSLGLGEAERATVQGARSRLQPHFGAWIDAFYTRLLVDPVAMQILSDDARVIRLKRSLESWFDELLTLPWDRAYERARDRIGSSHVRLHMPLDLMVTAMGGLRIDVIATIRSLDEDEATRERLADLMGRALDMELALLLLAFRRSERAEARRKDRMVYAERSARRMAHALYDRVDAAFCYAQLAEDDPKRRGEWLGRLRDTLRGLARLDQRARVHAHINGMPPEPTSITELCRRALADVSVEGATRIRYDVDPPDLVVPLVGPAVQLAVEELAQNGARFAPGGTVRVVCRPLDAGGLVVEVVDDGPGWPPRMRTFQDIYREGSGLGLSFCELVAELHEGRIELFRPSDGGAGVRLELAPRTPGSEASPPEMST